MISWPYNTLSAGRSTICWSFRKRPFLDTSTCEKYRIGYLSLSSKSLLRGRIVYPYLSADGELLTWFGRDPLYEEKKRQWLRRIAPKASR